MSDPSGSLESEVENTANKTSSLVSMPNEVANSEPGLPRYAAWTRLYLRDDRELHWIGYNESNVYINLIMLI